MAPFLTSLNSSIAKVTQLFNDLALFLDLDGFFTDFNCFNAFSLLRLGDTNFKDVFGLWHAFQPINDSEKVSIGISDEVKWPTFTLVDVFATIGVSLLSKIIDFAFEPCYFWNTTFVSWNNYDYNLPLTVKFFMALDFITCLKALSYFLSSCLNYQLTRCHRFSITYLCF